MNRDNCVRTGIQVHAPDQKQMYPLEALCAGRTVVLKVFGRFGCPFTRHDAYRLSQQKEQLEAVGASLVGIGFDEEGTPEFVRRRLWDGELYLDHTRQVYDFFRLRRMSKFQTVRCLMQRQSRILYSIFKAKFGATLLGDALQRGGTFVINCKGHLLYTCPQTSITDISDVAKVLQICKKEFMYRTFKVVSISTQPKSPCRPCLKKKPTAQLKDPSSPPAENFPWVQ